jgi:hypothetical protein
MYGNWKKASKKGFNKVDVRVGKFTVQERSSQVLEHSKSFV